VGIKRLCIATIVMIAAATVQLAGFSSSAEAATPTELNPLPLRTLHTKVGERYFYTASWSVAQSMDNSGLTPSSKRGMGFVFKNPDATETKPLYRLKQKSTGNWLVTASESEKASLLNNDFALEGTVGHIYKTSKSGTEPINRYSNGKGWRLAQASRDAEMKNAGYKLDGLVGYFLMEYYNVGAYYFGMFNYEGSPNLRAGVRAVYDRDDWWGGVKDFYGQESGVPQDTRGWTGDFSHLKPAIGYYDNSQSEVLEQHIDQATTQGLNYFNFYYYWSNENKRPTIDGGLNAFLQATNRNKMKFTISPCFHPSDSKALELKKEDFALAADYISDVVAQPNFLTTQGGRPLMFMCDIRGVDNKNVASANEFVALIKQTVKAKTGKTPFIMHHSEYGDDYVKQLNGEGLTCLNHGKSIVNGSYQMYLDELKSYFTHFDAQRPMLRCITQDFNEMPRTDIAMPKSDVRYYRDFSKSKFVQGLGLTKQSMRAAPASEIDNYATVYAWNEWHEGGVIEPNVRDGDYYLQQLRNVFLLQPR